MAATVEGDDVKCSRCKKEADDGTWESGCNYGRIQLGLSSQIFAALCPGKPDAWKIGHPAAVKNDAQEVIFDWGENYNKPEVSDYVLCRECQKELIGIVGRFFRYGEGGKRGQREIGTKVVLYKSRDWVRDDSYVTPEMLRERAASVDWSTVTIEERIVDVPATTMSIEKVYG